MKTQLFIVLALSFIFSACKKSGSKGDGTFEGIYKGDITTTMNGTVSQILKGHTLEVSAESKKGQVTLTGNIIISNSAQISGNTLTISRTVAASTQYFDVVEYGTGTFANNTLTIEFHQEQVQKPGNTIALSAVWTGVLIRQ